MTKIAEGILKFFNDFFSTLLSLVKVILKSDITLQKPKTSSRPAYILANGPSLRKSLELYSEIFQSEELYCVNYFGNQREFFDLRPSNYVLLDPAFFIDDLLKSPFDQLREAELNLKKVNWPMKMFIPKSAKDSALYKSLVFNTQIEVVFFNYTIFEGFDFVKHLAFRKLWAMPQCQNVLGATLTLAIVRRHPEIYIFGADHSWHEEIRLSDENEIIARQIHFYDPKGSIDYGKYTDRGFSKMFLQFQAFYKTFRTYEVLDKFARHLGVAVYNCSERSYIDSFPKKKLSQS